MFISLVRQREAYAEHYTRPESKTGICRSRAYSFSVFTASLKSKTLVSLGKAPHKETNCYNLHPEKQPLRGQPHKSSALPKMLPIAEA